MTRRYELPKQDGFTNKKTGRRLIPKIGWKTICMTRWYEISKKDEFTNKKTGQRLIPETGRGKYLYD